jgi:hypothetical protein
MHEGDDPSFWDKFMKFTFLFTALFKQVPKYLATSNRNRKLKKKKYNVLIDVLSTQSHFKALMINNRDLKKEI